MASTRDAFQIDTLGDQIISVAFGIDSVWIGISADGDSVEEGLSIDDAEILARGILVMVEKARAKP